MAKRTGEQMSEVSDDALDPYFAMAETAARFTADEWEAAIVACNSGSIAEEACRAMRWLRLAQDGVVA